MLKAISYYRKSSDKNGSKVGLNKNVQLKVLKSYLKKKGGSVVCPKQ